jgi:hypothetical protein
LLSVQPTSCFRECGNERESLARKRGRGRERERGKEREREREIRQQIDFFTEEHSFYNQWMND